MSAAPDPTAAPAGNFIRAIVESDLASGKYAVAHVARQARPGERAGRRAAATRRGSARAFRPSRTATCTIGHAKSICLNFGLAARQRRRVPPALRRHQPDEGGGGVRRLDRRRGALAGLRLGRRISTTRPTTTTSSTSSPSGSSSTGSPTSTSQTRRRDAARARHADRAGQEQPATATAASAENLDLFRRMRAGEFPDGAHVLRLKIDMRVPNINLRDPAIYRIRHAHAPPHRRQVVHLPALRLHARHLRRAREHHPLDLHARVPGPSAALRLGERAARRRRACSRGRCRSRYEFARLNLTYVVLSKRS